MSGLRRFKLSLAQVEIRFDEFEARRVLDKMPEPKQVAGAEGDKHAITGPCDLRELGKNLRVALIPTRVQVSPRLYLLVSKDEQPVIKFLMIRQNMSGGGRIGERELDLCCFLRKFHRRYHLVDMILQPGEGSGLPVRFASLLQKHFAM